MNIAIIGAGNVGRALAISSLRAGHSVVLTATHSEAARKVATEVGADAAGSNAEAVASAEVVILAVPADAVVGIADELGDALDRKVVIDVTNRVNPDDPGAVLDGTSTAEALQARSPAARVVKAFNTAFAARQADPVVDGVRLDGYVAGDDAEAKKTVLRLVEAIGFVPIDAGPLAMARALEGMGLLNITLNIRNGWPWQDGWKLIGPTG
jgi:8-hydroxy-5-deazaflavin:NADPH oxidoreductase